jgi:cell wall-associated NlpC family hydrolase
MVKRTRYFIAALLAVVLTVSSACTNRNSQGIEKPQNQSNPIRPLSLSPDDARIPLVEQNGMKYVPLQELTNVIGFQTKWIPETTSLAIGDIDPFYQLTMNSTQAEIEEKIIQLSSAPNMIDGKMHVSVDVMDDVFKEDMHYKVVENELIVHGVPLEPGMENLDDAEETDTTEVDFFGDDPNDPFKGDDPEGETDLSTEQNTIDEQISQGQGLGQTGGGEDGKSFQAAALRNINMNSLISVARRYLGVPYDFGTGPYQRTGKFDCSSYTQYVFGKFGVKLTRISRNQARQGVWVSRRLLRKGDLVFFAVPGRFKSNRTVGHVGIYIGNGKMINTFSNKKGVHITYVNRGYWSKKFLSAKRVAY